MKSYESRIIALEQKINPQMRRLVITYIVDEELEYWANNKLYIRPKNDISHEDFIWCLKIS